MNPPSAFLKKATTKPEKRSIYGWQMEMITHCGERLVLAVLQECHDVCIIHLRPSQLILCHFVSPRLYIHMYQLAGVSVLLHGTLGMFSPEWPLILSCKTWCGGYTEYWVNRSEKHESVFMSVSCCCNEAHSLAAGSKKWWGVAL